MTTYSRDRTQCFLNQCFARISAVPALLCCLGILPRRALLCAEWRSQDAKQTASALQLSAGPMFTPCPS